MIDAAADYLYRQALEADKHMRRTREVLDDYLEHVSKDVPRWEKDYPEEKASIVAGVLRSRYKIDDSKSEHELTTAWQR